VAGGAAVRKKLAIVLVILAVVIVCCGFVAVLNYAPESKVDYDSFVKIKKGMTWQQVGEILGGPPDIPKRRHDALVGGNFADCWNGSSCCIWVVFSASGEVDFAKMDAPQYEATLLDTVRRWLRR
jgi:hypothetical protein